MASCTEDLDGERERVWTLVDDRDQQALRDCSRYRSSHAQVQFNGKDRRACWVRPS